MAGSTGVVYVVRMHHAASKILIGSLAALLATATVPGTTARAAQLDIRIKGAAPRGDLPPKSARGESDTVGVVGEAAGETEFRAVDEISTAVASGQEAGPNGETAMRVLAVPGKGGLQNVRDVLERPNLDFGIAPGVILEKAAATDGMANLRKRLAYVAPLYVEEVHLLAGAGISAAADLEGRTVAVGPEGGATEFLAREVMARLGVRVREVNIAGAAAVQAVREGRADAAFVVSGKPVESVRGIAGDGRVHLVPLPVEAVPEGFVPTSLGHSDYPSLVPEGGKVATYGVQNVLFGYNWPAGSARGKAGRTFLAILMYRLPDLQVGAHHPKWREVNVAATMDGWKRLPSMQEWLDKARPKGTGPASEAEFEGFLKRTGTQVTGENRDALYRDFLRWRNSPSAVSTR